MLTSTSNPSIKRIVRLRSNRARRKEGCILVDGWRETRRAIEAGMTPRAIYAVASDADTHPASAQDDTIDGCECWVREQASKYIQDVSPDVMQRIGYGNSSRGAVAEFESVERPLASLQPSESSLILVLDEFEKPGNIGAVFRSADAAGIGGVIICPASTDVFNPNSIRSSLGAIFTVPFALCDESEARQWLAERQFRILTMRVESSKPIWEQDFSGPTAIVIGNEARGLQDRWKLDGSDAGGAIAIPMHGQVDSLNASVTAAVTLFEAQRQRARISFRKVE
ncbi:MAG: TrmH family RNA methyltransferase [Planctomycetota bacterium]